MGYSRCKVAFAVCSGYALTEEAEGRPPPDVDAFRASLPGEWKPLLIGPVRSAVNGYVMFALLWDGSKEGWETAEQGDEIRSRFTELFSAVYGDRSSPFRVLHAEFRWGGDEPGAGYEPELEVTSNAHRVVTHPYRGVSDDSLAWKLDQMRKQAEDGSERQQGYREAVVQITRHFGL